MSDFMDKALFKLGTNAYVKKESQGNGGNKVFSHVTHYLAYNAGDTTLSKCVRRTFNKLSDVKEWNIIGVKAPVTDQTIASINRSDAVIIGGGGLFLPDANPASESVSGWLWAVSEDQLNSIEVPLCIFSVGYNYFPGQEPNDIFKKSLNTLAAKSSFFGLRSYGSANAVKALLPEEYKEKAVFQPCTTNLIRKVFTELPAKKETKNIAVNIAFDRQERRFGDKTDTILSQTAAAVRKIQDKGYHIFNVSHRSGDDKFMPYLEKAGVSFKFIDFSRKFPDRLINFYNDMDLVIGMRTHAQMVPFGLNCDIISLGTHEKMRWFLEDFDALDWYIDMTEDIDTLGDRIINTFEQIHEKDHDTTKMKLLDTQEDFWKINCRNIEFINSL